MEGILKGIQVLACEMLTGTATDVQVKELEESIKEMHEMPSSLRDEAAGVIQTYTIRSLFPLQLSCAEDISNKIHADLSVQRLNDIKHLLFMARAGWGILSLHSQCIWGRNIVVCEDACLHLVWYDDIIYIKPMPLYLLNNEFLSHSSSARTVTNALTQMIS
jgi:hypothetical protein